MRKRKMAYDYVAKAKTLYGKSKEKYIVGQIMECLRDIEKAESRIEELKEGKIKTSDYDSIDLTLTSVYPDPDKG